MVIMKRVFLLFIVVFLSISNSLFSQNDSLFNKEFVGFSNQISLDFTKYADTINKQFATELRKQWVAFDVFEGKQKTIQPKPTHPIVADTIHKPSQPRLIPNIEKVPQKKSENRSPDRPIPISNPENPILSPSSLQKIPVDIQKTSFEIIPFGEPIEIQYSKDDFQYALSNVSNDEIANCWESISKSDYISVLDQIKRIQSTNSLNDWGVFVLVNTISEKIISSDPFHKSSIFTVFILNQLGYDSKISYNQDRLFCMVNAQQQIYDVPYIELKDKIYYFLDYSKGKESLKSIKTYYIDYSENQKSLNMFLLSPLDLSPSPIFKTVLNENDQNVKIKLNKNLISFYESYPQVDLIVYANASVSKEFKESIISYFQPILKNKTQVEAVSWILRFCQFQFDYANDKDQFGYEKPFFCEENFFYPKNDCEDRSLFFSFIIREILHQDIVLLHYPGHLATAVQMDDELNGDYLILNGKKYYVCDPTYIGATMGMTMPQFQNVTPEIITLSK